MDDIFADITALSFQMFLTAKEKGWYDLPRSPVENHMLIVSEIAEATECVRNGERAFYISPEGKPEGELTELVDALIRIMDYSASRGWDLGATLRQKIEYNKTRSYRHGGKLL